MPLGKNTRLRPVTLIAVVLAISAACLAQKDPGLRAGLPGAGAPLNGFTPIELSMFQEGVQRAIQLEAWATQGVPNPDLFEAKVGGTAWKSKPNWYIVGRKDRTVHPDLERFFAKRMGATTYELESSHVPMLSQPDRVLDVIRTAAKAVQESTAGKAARVTGR